MDSAAEALLLGVADPVGHLAHGTDDWTISAAVVQRAAQIRAERLAEEYRVLARMIANELAKILS